MNHANNNRKIEFMKKRVTNFLDNLSVARKSAILIAVTLIGILFFGAFGHLSLYKFKNNYNNFYETKYELERKIHSLHTTYENNTIKQSYKTQWKLFKKINPNLEGEKQKIYKKIIKNADKHLNTIFNAINLQNDKEIQKSLTSFHINLEQLSTLLYKSSKDDLKKINNQYNYILWMMLFLTLFLILFSAIFTSSIVKSIKKLINNLSNIVQNKMDDYENLAHSYEDKVTKEVIRNREKDQIMYQHARLAAMGEMIGNIAHQWRQPLNALTILIQSFGTKSMTGKLDQVFIDKQVDEGLRLAQQMSTTIEDFRNFFSPHKEREYFSIEKSIDDTLELVEFFCKDEHIDIQILVKEDLRVFGYSNEFAQVILNLINNARDNFKHRNINDKRKIIIKLEKKLKPKPFAMISFIDNGGGIDPTIKDRIFEPYFTTKHKSTGTGIGLYMSKQIIEKQMQGLVTVKNVESTMGTNKVFKCAQFIIAIPIK